MNLADISLSSATGFLALIGILGNGRVLHKLLPWKIRVKRSRYAAIQLAAASSLVYLVLVAPFRISLGTLDYIHLETCQGYAFIDAVLFAISIHATVIAAFERQERFARPFRKHSSVRTLCLIFGISIVGSIAVSSPFLGTNDDFDGESCLTHPYASSKLWHGMALIVVQCLFPLLCDVYFNATAWRAIHKQNLNCAFYTHDYLHSYNSNQSHSRASTPSGTPLDSTSSETPVISSPSKTPANHAHIIRNQQARHAKMFCAAAFGASSVSIVSTIAMLILAMQSDWHYGTLTASALFLGKCLNAVANPFIYLTFGRKFTGLEKWKRKMETDSVFISNSLRRSSDGDEKLAQEKHATLQRPRSCTFTLNGMSSANSNATLCVPTPTWRKMTVASGLTALDLEKPPSRKLSYRHTIDDPCVQLKSLKVMQQMESMRGSTQSFNGPFSRDNTQDASSASPKPPGRKWRRSSSLVPVVKVKRSYSDSSITTNTLFGLTHFRPKIISPRKPHSKSNVTDDGSTSSYQHIILPVIVITSDA